MAGGVDKLLTQQIREVDEEQRVRATTALTRSRRDDRRPCEQYEENPISTLGYGGSPAEPMTVDDYSK